MHVRLQNGLSQLNRLYGLVTGRLLPRDLSEEDSRDYGHVLAIVFGGILICFLYGFVYSLWDHPVARIGTAANIFVFWGLCTSLYWVKKKKIALAILHLIIVVFSTLVVLSFAFGRAMHLHYYFLIVSGAVHVLHPRQHRWLTVVYGWVGVFLLLVLEIVLPMHPYIGPEISAPMSALSRLMALGFTYFSVTSYVWWSLRINARMTDQLAQTMASNEAAQAVQATLLDFTAETPYFSIRSLYHPSDVAGGDWLSAHYDEAQQWVFLYLGDVTGHGVSSALVTAAVAGAAAATLAQMQSLEPGEKDLNDTLDKLCFAMHAAVLRTGTPSGRLMTLVVIGIDLKSGEAHYRNAGHTPLLWVNQKVNTVLEGSSPLGFHRQLILGRRRFQMEEGDRIFLYSDGLLSNRSEEGKTMNWATLRRHLMRSAEPADLLAQLQPYVDDFAPESDRDDTACIAFLWRKAAA